MAGKSKQQKKKRAKTKRREKELLGQKKVTAQTTKSETEQLEEAKRQAESEAEALEPEPTELLCPLCGKPSIDGKVHDECADREAMLADVGEKGIGVADTESIPKTEPTPAFDPKSVVADILKKKDGA